MILPLPANKVTLGNQPLSLLMDSLFKMIRGKKKSFLGFLRAESGLKQHLLFILESDPYAATLLEEEAARSLSIRDFFTALNGMNSPVLSLYAANPVFIKCLLVFSQKTPATQGTTALIDIEVLLRQLQTEQKEDAVLVLKKGKEVNFFYFLKGRLEELYFANPGGIPKEGSPEDQLLVYAFSGSKESPITLMVYKDLAVSPAEDTDVMWEELPAGMMDYFLRPRPELNIVKGGETIEKRVLQKRRYLIGRGEANDLTLDDAGASREHAVLEERGGKFYIEDRKSKNGTLLNGKRITSSVLSDGDEIRVGDYRMFFSEKQEQASPKIKVPVADLDTTMVISSEAIQPPKAAPVRSKPLVLEVVSGGETGKIYELSRKLILGRSKADVPLKDGKVSRQHASVEETAEGYLYSDLGSMNGSFINGASVQSKLLSAGDVITIGESMIRVIEQPQ